MDLVKTQNNNEQLQLFNKLLLDARSSFIDAEFKISNIFDAPHKNEVVRLNKKSQAYVEANGWMSRSSALERLEQWKNVAFNQYLDPTIRNQNNQKLSFLFLICLAHGHNHGLMLAIKYFGLIYRQILILAILITSAWNSLTSFLHALMVWTFMRF